MKTNIKTLLATAGLGLAVTALSAVSVPTDTAAYSLIGGNLSQSQRDFRVFNNFTDSTANNNTTAHVNFPGHTGAVMAIWKGAVEWASGPYAGNGLGDGITGNANLGDGGANFDHTFQGLTSAVGGTNNNVHSEETTSSGSTLAYTETPISDGWRIRYISSWTWHDGPGSVSSGVDIQGVACHEIGHSLGLGHSGTGGATMFPSISGTGTAARSIHSDDIAGIQAIYGAKSASKPVITALGGSKNIGGVLVISGSNFSPTNNEVWFTKTNSDGNPTKVTGVTSSGTSISVTIPSNVQDGEVLVRNNGTGHSNLSNAFPIDIGGVSGNPPDLVSVSPSQGAAGGFTSVTLTGTNFTGASSVKFGALESLEFTVNSATSITAVSPGGALFSTVNVSVTTATGTDTLSNAFAFLPDPAPSISSVTPNTSPAAGGVEVEISGASVVGVTGVTFGGVPGTNLVILDANTLQVETPPHALGAVNVVATGNGSSTIVNGMTYVNFGTFEDIGPGLGGVFGVPVLTGSGDLSAGSGTGFTIDLIGALGLSSSSLFAALGNGGAVPFKGGTFYPIPILTQVIIPTDIFGEVHLSSAIPAGTPAGTKFTMQFWISDFTAPAGLSGSNGLRATVP